MAAHLLRAFRHRNYQLSSSAARSSRFFLFATIGDTVADRTNRHPVIVITQTISMMLPLTLAALTFTGVVHVWHVFALGACLSLSDRRLSALPITGSELKVMAAALALTCGAFRGA